MSIISDLSKVQKWSDYIQGDSDIKEVRVHPRQEQFARMLITPRDFTLYYPLVISHDVPEYEMHVVFKDHTDIVVLG
jgi:hypothetical protein